MSWQPMTGFFRKPKELAALEKMTAEALLRALLASDPIVALRALKEIKLHGDTARVDFLTAQPEFMAHCQKYTSDPEITSRDYEYAEEFGLD